MKRITTLFLTLCFLVLFISICFTMAGKAPWLKTDSDTESDEKPIMTPGGYYTKGRWIYNSKGEKMMFRGVARPGWGNKADGDHLSHPNEYPEIAKWGANIVRLPMNQHLWLKDEMGGNGKSYQTEINETIKLIIDNGMVAIADLHHAGWNMADETSLAFWIDFAKQYKDNPQVMFELWNEPKDVSYEIWMKGGVVGDATHVGMQQLYDAIRKLGAHNLIIIGGLNWGYDLRGLHQFPLSKDAYNVVYSTHLYNYGGKREENWVDTWMWLIDKHPIIIGEFGYTHDCKKPDGTYSLDYTKAVYKVAEDNELHWTAWAWTSIFLKHTIFVRNIPHTYDPANNVFEPLTEHGQLVKDNLAKNKK